MRVGHRQALNMKSSCRKARGFFVIGSINADLGYKVKFDKSTVTVAACKFMNKAVQLIL